MISSCAFAVGVAALCACADSGQVSEAIRAKRATCDDIDGTFKLGDVRRGGVARRPWQVGYSPELEEQDRSRGERVRRRFVDALCFGLGVHIFPEQRDPGGQAIACLADPARIASYQDRVDL